MQGIKKASENLKYEISNKEAINKEYISCKANLEKLNEDHHKCAKELVEYKEKLENQITTNNAITSKAREEKEILKNKITELLLSEEELNKKIKKIT